MLRRAALKFVFIPIVLSVVACSWSAAAIPPTVVPTATLESTEASTTAIPGSLLEMDVNGVRVGIRVPLGWEMQTTNDGLLIAEHFGKMNSGHVVSGMQMHLFIYSVDDFDLPPDGPGINLAWLALNQIIARPSLIGKAQVSDPAGFEWDLHDAAYYLVNTGDGNMMVVLAVAVKQPNRLVVCNIVSPVKKASLIRGLIPQMLSGLTLDGTRMDSKALTLLPDPLLFPGYNDAAPEATAPAR